ncbi:MULTISPECIES: alpha/beta fold hydrolase [Microbacterium]|uniref:Soluble epoxide hydrolase n=1 Tax=Microbacterium trichothecenolyticum TaxID=69370 RepID=A0A0M2HEN8_MICTR|nr:MULTISPECIES: alpha/beta fold hydrolase [Microbacterium]KJL43171.1 Soluble epoxide hydrolase [Microbacterium trichothecenolyticum]MDR7190364.1 pimeloyl-ACP methyl ester carboxylesterase [Microbacterium sp. BE35]
MTDVTGLRSRMVTANGLRMHVTEIGAGEPVLLLHGFPQSSREWAPVMAGLADRARLIAPDLRGAGETEAPPSGYDARTVLHDVIALLDELGIERVDLVGHDWGALVGFDLCLGHPDRVRRYVAIAVPAPYFDMTPALLAGMGKAMPHLWFQWAIATPVLGPRLLSRGRQRLARWLLRGFERRPMDSADVEAYVAALRDPARARAASKLYRGLILPAFMKIMRGGYRGRVLNTPTLVLFGADDALLPKDAMAVRPEDAPHTTVEFVPGGAHFLVDDNPDEVTRRVAGFLLD